MSTKERLSASVDADLLDAVHYGIRRGEADSVSAWISDAIRLKVDHEQRMRGVDEFLGWWEAEHGPITAEDEAATDLMLANAIQVRRADRRPAAPAEGEQADMPPESGAA